MTKLFVKICGITRRQDAELASGLGAAALGFIFWPGSPRYLAPEDARSIAEVVPSHVWKVGVFVDEPVSEVARIVRDVGLNAAQVHGHETPEYCRELKGRVMREAGPSGPTSTIIKTVSLGDDGARQVADFDPDIVFLVDAHDPARYGGTGRTVNWDLAGAIAAARPTILAGGLTAANIRLAVRTVRPYGVDVSSGVESSPGIKDPARLRSLFEALHD